MENCTNCSHSKESKTKDGLGKTLWVCLNPLSILFKYFCNEENSCKQHSKPQAKAHD